MRNRMNDAEENMRANDKEKIVEELRAKLAWYTKEATKEEFDSKAVESILYLLDIYEPVVGQYANADDAWVRFKMRIAERSTGGVEVQSVASEAREEKADEAEPAGKVINFVQRQKIVVAAVLVILLLALVGTTQTEAIKQNGFFFWLRQDECGRQMVTSPESLESTLDDVCGERYYDWDDVPKWCLKLLSMTDELIEEGILEWKYVNVIHMSNYDVAKSCYIDMEEQDELIIGIISYVEKVSINTEVFDSYNYIQCYEENDTKTIYMYERKDNQGCAFWRLCIFDGNKVYFVEGNKVERLKELIRKLFF